MTRMLTNSRRHDLQASLAASAAAPSSRAPRRSPQRPCSPRTRGARDFGAQRRAAALSRSRHRRHRRQALQGQGRQHRRSSGSIPAACGRKDRRGMRRASIWSGATSPPIASCAISTMTATSPSSSTSRPNESQRQLVRHRGPPAQRRAHPAGPLRAQWLASRRWPSRPTASRSTGRTTWWCIPTTSRSGSPIPATARSASTKGKRANTGSLQPYQKEAVYRIDAQTGQVTKVADEPFKPNGIAFSHDYKKLYVCDTGITHYPQCQERGLAIRPRRRQALEPEAR